MYVLGQSVPSLQQYPLNMNKVSIAQCTILSAFSSEEKANIYRDSFKCHSQLRLGACEIIIGKGASELNGHEKSIYSNNITKPGGLQMFWITTNISLSLYSQWLGLWGYWSKTSGEHQVADAYSTSRISEF